MCKNVKIKQGKKIKYKKILTDPLANDYDV